MQSLYEEIIKKAEDEGITFQNHSIFEDTISLSTADKWMGISISDYPGFYFETSGSIRDLTVHISSAKTDRAFVHEAVKLWYNAATNYHEMDVFLKNYFHEPLDYPEKFNFYMSGLRYHGGKTVRRRAFVRAATLKKNIVFNSYPNSEKHFRNLATAFLKHKKQLYTWIDKAGDYWLKGPYFKVFECSEGSSGSEYCDIELSAGMQIRKNTHPRFKQKPTPGSFQKEFCRYLKKCDFPVADSWFQPIDREIIATFVHGPEPHRVFIVHRSNRQEFNTHFFPFGRYGEYEILYVMLKNPEQEMKSLAELYYWWVVERYEDYEMPRLIADTDAVQNAQKSVSESHFDKIIPKLKSDTKDLNLSFEWGDQGFEIRSDNKTMYLYEEEKNFHTIYRCLYYLVLAYSRKDLLEGYEQLYDTIRDWFSDELSCSEVDELLFKHENMHTSDELMYYNPDKEEDFKKQYISIKLEHTVLRADEEIKRRFFIKKDTILKIIHNLFNDSLEVYKTKMQHCIEFAGQVVETVSSSEVKGPYFSVLPVKIGDEYEFFRIFIGDAVSIETGKDISKKEVLPHQFDAQFRVYIREQGRKEVQQWFMPAESHVLASYTDGPEPNRAMVVAQSQDDTDAVYYVITGRYDEYDVLCVYFSEPEKELNKIFELYDQWILKRVKLGEMKEFLTEADIYHKPDPGWN